MARGRAGNILDLLEDALILHNPHADKLLCTPVFVQDIVGILAELLHVGTDEHLAQFNEVTVVLVVNFDNTPWVRTAPDFATIRCLDKLIRTDNSERDLASDLFSFGERLLVLVLVGRRLENVNVVVGNIGQNLS